MSSPSSFSFSSSSSVLAAEYESENDDGDWGLSCWRLAALAHGTTPGAFGFFPFY